MPIPLQNSGPVFIVLSLAMQSIKHVYGDVDSWKKIRVDDGRGTDNLPLFGVRFVLKPGTFSWRRKCRKKTMHYMVKSNDHHLEFFSCVFQQTWMDTDTSIS
jgi:hypothetical protein